jgi:hypothetical protein
MAVRVEFSQSVPKIGGLINITSHVAALISAAPDLVIVQ